MSDKTLTIDELAMALKLSPDTIKTKYKRHPETLPPSICLPGGKKPLWLESTVYSWLKHHEKSGAEA